MKRNKSIFSLLAILSLGLTAVYAKSVVTPGDWEDDDPVVVVTFINVPTAEYSGLHLKLTSDDPEASIMWTTDASLDPEMNGWKKYTAPLSLTEDCTVRFYASLGKGKNSEVGSYTFVYADHQVKAPVISADAEGTVLTMSCSTPGAKIRYTTDGTEPDVNSTLYTGPVTVASYIYKARAFADNLFPSETVSYTSNVTTYAVPVPSAEFVNLGLKLSCDDPLATILYTFDPNAGVDNASAWTRYTAPLQLTENCMVRFFGRREGYNDSDVNSFNFVITNYRAADPTIERNAAGTHLVMETTTPNGEIRYTTDGSEPTAQSTLYTAPVLIEGNFTYTAKTFAQGLFESKPNRYVVTNLAAPDPYAVFGLKKFSLYCIDTNAQIWYTTVSDATPDKMADWTLYTEPFALTGDCTLRFFSRRDNYNDSDIESLTVVYADYQNIAPTVKRNAQGTHLVMTAVPLAPQTGLIPGGGEVPELSAPEIRYTTDGSEPTATSTLYLDPVRIQSGKLYRARVFDLNYYDSEVTDYEIGSWALPVPVAEFRNLSIVLTCSDADASIWYTTNPDATLDNLDDWTLYTAPIVPDADCTYRFFAGDDDDNASDIQSYVFQRADHTAAAPTIERTDDGAYVEMASATEDADIRFTTDGSEPTLMSQLYVEPVAIPCNTTFLARTFADGMYDSEVTEFVVNNMAVPVAYARVENKKLLLSCTDGEATIWYTTDASATQENMDKWKRYTAPIELSQNATFYFFTRRDNFNDSDIETFVFLRANYQVETPSIYRSEDGNFLVMECFTEGAEIHYTTDGSDPTPSSTLYTEPVFAEGQSTYRVRAFADGLFDSPIAEYSVSSLTSAEPMAVFENLQLTITVDDPEAQIWYSVEGAVKALSESEQDNNWLLYQEPITFDGDCVVRYFTSRAGYNNSMIKTFSHVYADHQVSTPLVWASQDGKKVEMSCDDDNAEVRYTTDKSDPDRSSQLYNGPVTLAQGWNYIRARAFVEGKYPSEAGALDYYVEEVGIADVAISDSLAFTVFNGVAGFVSGGEQTLRLYNVQGILVITLQLSEGFNALPELPAVVYIAAGKKIVVK